MGKIFVSMTNKEINYREAIELCRSDDCGAEVLFVGIVRNKNDGRSVNSVYYDGHVALGEKVLNDICLEAKALWGEDLNLYVVHRLGLLNIGVESLIIYVTSVHRDNAYQSSRYIIEQIKLRLPVWKEENYCDGDKKWLVGQTLNLE